jgi:hypothetical protein
MDIRLNEKNKTILLIKNAEEIIKRNIDTIARFNQLPSSTFNTNKIKALKLENQEKGNFMIEMKLRIEKIEKGELDGEFKIILEKNKKELKLKMDEKLKKDNNTAQYNKEKKELLDTHYTVENKTRRNDKFAEKNMTKAYDYFLKSMDSIPDYILKNLENMPNNRGYIWKGIHCYGALKEDSDILVMTEKLYNNVTKIHEWNHDEYLVYSKDKFNNKKILHRQPRNKILK